MDPKVMALDSETTTTTAAPDGSSSTTSTTAAPSSTNATAVNEEDGLPSNLTQITSEDTLKDSKLAGINVNETSEADITAAFCREVGAISGRYEVREEAS